MAILRPTEIVGKVVWLGLVADREVTLCSDPVDKVSASFDGFAGECHGGATRPSCSRVKLQYDRGTEIRNTRQVSVLSEEELTDVAAEMGIPSIAPEWTGANVILQGIPQFTMIPPASRLLFSGGVAIGVDMENGPCKYVGDEIERHHPGKGTAFPRIARERRGVTGWVEKPGEIAVGETVRLHVPPQRIYQPALKAREAEMAK